jgi:hypothetical protein
VLMLERRSRNWTVVLACLLMCAAACSHPDPETQYQAAITKCNTLGTDREFLVAQCKQHAWQLRREQVIGSRPRPIVSGEERSYDAAAVSRLPWYSLCIYRIGGAITTWHGEPTPTITLHGFDPTKADSYNHAYGPKGQQLTLYDDHWDSDEQAQLDALERIYPPFSKLRHNIRSTPLLDLLQAPLSVRYRVVGVTPQPFEAGTIACQADQFYGDAD